MANAARDPEDEPDSPTSREEPALDEGKTNLMTDFDGLSRPGTSSNSARLLTPPVSYSCEKKRI